MTVADVLRARVAAALDEWDPGTRFDDFPAEVLSELTSDTAELVDWK